MNRRNMLQSGLTLSAAVMAGLAQAADKKPQGHEHMHHHPEGGALYADLVAATTQCVTAGEACIDHCLELLGQGDKDMAACAKGVEQMLAACTALRQLAAWQSTFTPRMAKVVMDICKHCEDECRKHEKKHQECKDCAESCAACYAACKKVAA